jgi:hypothetical protein
MCCLTTRDRCPPWVGSTCDVSSHSHPCPAHACLPAKSSSRRPPVLLLLLLPRGESPANGSESSRTSLRGASPSLTGGCFSVMLVAAPPPPPAPTFPRLASSTSSSRRSLGRHTVSVTTRDAFRRCGPSRQRLRARPVAKVTQKPRAAAHQVVNRMRYLMLMVDYFWLCHQPATARAPAPAAVAKRQTKASGGDV